MIDNVLMFFTSFKSRYGQEVFDHYEICLNYTHSWRFVFDYLSMLGISAFENISERFRYFHLFKATRVNRISKAIYSSNTPIKVKSLMKIVNLVFFIGLYIHWTACIVNMAVLYNGPLTYFVKLDGSYIDIHGNKLSEDLAT